jgi:hypothetical protein
MSTVFSPSPRSLGLDAALQAREASALPDGGRSLAALLLAAAVAALVVLADQLIETWVDGHLFLGWVALWVVIFSGSVLLAGSARRVAARTLAALDDWSRSLAEARAQARLWEMAKLDPRLKAELLQARAREQQAADAALSPTTERDFPAALAPLDMLSDQASPAMVRRMAQAAMRHHAGYLPYL